MAIVSLRLDQRDYEFIIRHPIGGHFLAANLAGDDPYGEEIE